MPDKEVFAFVLMPFDDRFDDVYEIGIKEAAQKAGVRAERLSDQLYAEGMLDRIYRQIDGADLVIADMSDRNPNVFYEVGYAHAKEKLVILITDDASSIPFDLQHRRHLVYGDSVSFLREELQRHLLWAVKEIENVRESQIRVVSTVTGKVEKTEYKAAAKVDLKIDLFNESSRPSPEIHGIYYYTESDWNFSQDQVDCPRSDSDIQPYKYRFQIRPPHPRLAPSQWAQISMAGSRTLAVKWRGEELKDEYTLSGTSMLRLLTNQGNFDYELPISLTIDHLPF